MSESTIECLHHYDIAHLQVRRDYMRIYKNETQCKIIRVLETWTNRKMEDWQKACNEAKEAKQELPALDTWITMSYQQFSTFMFDTVKKDTIKKEITELLTMGHIIHRVHPTNPYGPPQYKLDLALLQNLLQDTTPEGIMLLSLGGGNVTTPYESSPPPMNITPRVGVMFTPGVGGKVATSNNTTKITSKTVCSEPSVLSETEEIQPEEEHTHTPSSQCSNSEQPSSQQHNIIPPATRLPSKPAREQVAVVSSQRASVPPQQSAHAQPRQQFKAPFPPTERQRKVIECWDTLQGFKTPTTPRVWEAVTTLLQAGATVEGLKLVRDEMMSTPYWKERLTIENAARCYGELYVLAQQKKLQKSPEQPIEKNGMDESMRIVLEQRRRADEWRNGALRNAV